MGTADSPRRTGVDEPDPSPAGRAASSPKLCARRKQAHLDLSWHAQKGSWSVLGSNPVFSFASHMTLTQKLNACILGASPMTGSAIRQGC